MTCIPDLLSPPEEFAKAVQSLADSIQERQMEYIEFSSLGDDTLRRIPIFGATRVWSHKRLVVGECGPELFMPGIAVQDSHEATVDKPKALPAISGLTTVQDGRYQAWRDTQ